MMPTEVFHRRALRSAAFLIALLLFLSLCFVGSYVSAPVFADRRTESTKAEIVASQPLPERSQPARSATNATLLNLPLSFEPAGKANEFLVRGGGYRLLLAPSVTTIALKGQDRESLVRMELAGANAQAEGVELCELPGKRNYLIGNDSSKWRTNVPTYSQVRYEEVYPGISLTYYGNQGRLEYDFLVAPGADPRQISFKLDRRVRPHISSSGDLELRIKGGEVIQRKPSVYQEAGGERRLIDSRFVLRGKRQAAFEVGPYDRTKPLVIDPTLVYSTYLGGSGDDLGSSIAVDSSNNVYVAGTAGSTNFPTRGPAFANNAGLSDIFVTKIDGSGGQILYSTYIGGSGLDRGDGIAVDSSGKAYVVGRVDSSSINFPTTAGAFATTYRGGDFDGVLFKLNAQGDNLVYSTYVGGEENDSTEGVAVDASGNAYVTGGTKSLSFPTTVSAFQGASAGDTDAYLLKFNASGTGLLYGTMLGGNGTDRGSGVAIDSSGKAYVDGFTGSQDFPTVNAFQNSSGGGFDAFVAKIDTNASGAASLSFCTYLGGTGDDKAYGIAIDSGGNNVYLTGQTASNNFPLLNPAQTSPGGSFDGFIAKVSSAGANVYTTYLGGSGDDRAAGIAVNSSGAAYVTGFTSSTNFPTVTPLQIANGGGFDAFVAKLNPAGSALLYSTYLGGSANENTSVVTATNPIALDSSSNAYVTGFTASTNFPTASALQPTKGGGQDTFIAKISDATAGGDYSISVMPSSQTVSPGGSTTFTITATPAGGFIGNISLSVTGLSSDATSNFNPTTIALTDASAKSSVLTVNTTAATPPGTYSLTVSTTSGVLQHLASVQLIVSGTTSANLALTKTAVPNPAIAQADLTYRIAVTNNGPSPATNVSMTDNLPSGITFKSATPTQGSCSGTTTVTCGLGAMSRGALAVINIIVTPQSAGQLTNNATVSATEPDPNATDNLAMIQTTVNAPSSGPSMLDPNLSVKTVVSGLSQPTMMAFIGDNDFFVLEKNTGKVQRVTNGAIQSPAPLDLAVNSASERGLLGIALHPGFALNGYVYLYWTEISTGVDSTNIAEVPLLGNRVDRYIWNGATLTFDRNLIKLHAYQADAGQPLRGNHNGGILRFGPDGKLYIMMGDNGRRGFLQNLPCGPTSGPCPGQNVVDDQFGGPDPDNNHLTGFILRLNDDGSAPTDNPFYGVITVLPPESSANLRKLYAYGVRNGFGMGFDPYSGNLWDQENGDDAFDEMNRVTAGSNNGWVQMMGPNSRVSQFKQIESTYGTGDLQQLRWPPSLIADTPQAALDRLYILPGAHYNDPEFSWKYAVAPSPLGFVQGRGIGPQFEGDMFVGAARSFLSGGYLFRFKLTNDRLHFLFSDARLNDLVADNTDKFDITESESLLIGRDFNITTDIETGPNGNLFVVSNVNGAVYEISGKQPTLFVANLNGAQETPPNSSTATGTATVLLSPDETTARVSLNFSGLSSSETAAHIHGPGAQGVSAQILFPLTTGNLGDVLISLTPTDVANLKNGLLYINVHSSNFPSGEIRGQFVASASASSVQFNTASLRITEGGGDAVLRVTRLGDASTAATVDYATSDTSGANNCNMTNGAASSRCDYLATIGTLRFAANETAKNILIPIIDDSYAEGNETFAVTLSNPSGTVLGSPAVATVTITDNDIANGANPIDQAGIFVRLHYIDFLNREPDLSGVAFWTNEITSCGANAQCIEAKRINVSAAFFLSIEFQQTGYLIERLYKASYGDASGMSTLNGTHQLSVPIVRFNEFLPDTQKIGQGVVVNSPGWETVLENNRQAFTLEFVQRSRFITALPTSMSPGAFVDKLFLNAGVTPSTTARQDAINEFGSATNTADVAARSRALRRVAENATLTQQEFNRAFVLIQFFGYLRRNPNDPQDTDYTGYDFWLTKLNQFNGNFINAEMVKAFITSGEYRQRFGP